MLLNIIFQHDIINVYQIEIVWLFGYIRKNNLLKEDEIMMKKIKDLRSEHGVTQRGLAQAINVTQASVSRWEDNQTSISGRNLVKLAQFFNVTVDALLGLEVTETQ